MNVEVMLEKIENTDKTDNDGFKGDIIINNLSTSKTCNILDGILPKFGTINEIIHYRYRKSNNYRTIIKNNMYSIDIRGGLGSGYGGEGPHGFNYILKQVGIGEEEAKIVFNTQYDNAVITFKK